MVMSNNYEIGIAIHGSKQETPGTKTVEYKDRRAGNLPSQEADKLL